MIFKAKIKYNFIQSREAKLWGDKNIIDTEIEFTFEDIVGKWRKVNDAPFFIPASFSARELIIPWLQQGNIPEITENSA